MDLDDDKAAPPFGVLLLNAGCAQARQYTPPAGASGRSATRSRPKT
ncbi:hypothetical protein GHO42_02910 [Pseudomonas sp. FSL R10-0056]|nr:hypothetical protein [Pseudomonas sp. FSL R10-0056]MQT68578.1 hypothetical protein [Pseudomonas sp. FSL R10-0071]MQU47292.1 hypothetical protein [Pseudomonas sp. FSL A6-1183]